MKSNKPGTDKLAAKRAASAEQSLFDWASAWKTLADANSVPVVADPGQFDVIEWRTRVLSFRENLAREPLDETARMAFIMQGAAAAVAGYDLLKADLRNGIDEAELRSNHVTLTHLTCVLTDALIAAMAELAEHEGQAANELRQASSALGKIAVARRNESDPKRVAMAQIRDKWERMQAGHGEYLSDAKFARVMQAEYRILDNEGSIKNAISKWRKAQSSS